MHIYIYICIYIYIYIYLCLRDLWAPQLPAGLHVVQHQLDLLCERREDGPEELASEQRLHLPGGTPRLNIGVYIYTYVHTYVM